MTIYLTGDIHGDISINRLSHRNWPLGRELSRDDYLIILGDFGLVWSNDPDDRNDKYWLDWLDEKPWTTLFVDGNHENFARLNSDEFPVRDWKGGKAQFVRPNIIHLMRGEIYDIDGLEVLAFGGAHSHDREYRTEGISWWPEEVPSDDDRQHCLSNLAAHGNSVDLIVTHEAPSWAYHTALSKVKYAPNALSNWLQSNIADTVSFGRWYFGHHHIDVPEAKPYTPLFGAIVELELDSPCYDGDGVATDDYAAVWE